MKNLYLIVLQTLFGICNDASAQTPNYLWANKIGGVNNDESRSVAVDAAGNVYTTGYCQGTVDFDPGAGVYNLPSLGGMDIFISKLDPLGKFLWAKRCGGASDDRAFSNFVDVNGNVYIAGFFQGTSNFGPVILSSAGGWDIFISKMDASGNFLWVKRIGGVNNEVGFSIISDASGNVYTTGAFGGTVDFDPAAPPGTYNLTSKGGNDIFISKLNASGNFLWARRMGGANSDQSFAAAVDAAGNVYATGFFYGTADFGPVNLISAGNSDVFISKVDASGNFLWTKQLAGTDYSEGSSLTVDAGGAVYTTGYFNGMVDFDPGPPVLNMVSNGSSDIFISKLNASGNFVWAKSMGGSGEDRAYSNAVNADGDIYTTGYFFNTADFDPDTSTYYMASAGAYDIFISKLDASGDFLWAKQMSGINGEVAYGIASDATGNVYAAGYFEGMVDFNPGDEIKNLTSNGGQDVFIVKLCQMASPIITPIGPISLCQGNTATLTTNTASSYLWSNGATTQSITVSTTGNYSVVVTNANGCSASSSVTIVTVNPSPVATITPIGPISLCQGNTATLTANTASSYLWSNGATSQSITVSTSGNYSCLITNDFGCPATSPATTVIVNPVLPASVAIAGPSTICSGQNATFTANPTNGGASPAYQWFVNTSPVGSGSTYSTTTLTNGAQIYCIMSSNAACANPATDTSNSIVITVNPPLLPAVSVTVSALSICSGQKAIFTAIPTNGGTLPTYEWFVNGNKMGGNSLTFSTMALTNGAKVYCRLTSNAACANPKAVTSDTLIITVNPLLTPKVNIAASPECSYTATSMNGGTAPSFKWYVNNTLIGESNDSTYTNTTLVNGWELYCIMTSNADCAYPDTVKSNTIIVANCITVISTKDKEQLGHITVFPNPAGDFFTIEGIGLNSGRYRINLNNILGQTLIGKSMWISGQDLNTQLNIEEFPNGKYYIVIYSELNMYTIPVQKLK